MKKYRLVIFLFFAFMSTGCSMVQGLRDDLDEGEDGRKKLSSVGQNAANNFDYGSPENRHLPPPPATVSDDRLNKIAGTPIDYSGARAKSGRVTKADFANEASKNENSLWTEDGQNNYLFARNKLKTQGDLVTIKIEDGLRSDMILEVKKLLPPEYRDRDIIVPGITRQKDITEMEAASKGAAGEASAAASKSGAEGVAGEAGKTAISGVSKVSALNDANTESMTAEIVERYPNGNVRLRGMKHVPFKKKVRNMEVVAIARGADIDESDVIQSSKFLEQKVELYK